MFTIQTSLSKTDYDGQREVLVRVIINRRLRPRLRSGVLINPAYFIDGKIVIPHGGRLKNPVVAQVSRAKSDFEGFCSRLLNILSVSHGKVEGMSAEWIKMVLYLDEIGKIERVDGHLTFDAIRKAVKKETGLAKLHKAAYYKDGPTFYDYVKAYCQEKQLCERRIMDYKILCRIIMKRIHVLFPILLLGLFFYFIWFYGTHTCLYYSVSFHDFSYNSDITFLIISYLFLLISFSPFLLFSIRNREKVLGLNKFLLFPKPFDGNDFFYLWYLLETVFLILWDMGILLYLFVMFWGCKETHLISITDNSRENLFKDITGYYCDGLLFITLISSLVCLVYYFEHRKYIKHLLSD